MAKKTVYVTVPYTDVRKVKSYVYSLPKNEQRKYYSLVNSISNNFYGSTKGLTDGQHKLLKSILKK